MSYAKFGSAAIALVLGLPMVSWAATIASTLSPGNSYNDGTGYSLGYPGPVGSAFAFVPTIGSNYSMTELDVAVTHITGPNSASVELLADAAGSPGALIQSWTTGALPQFGSAHTIQASQQITGISGVTLVGGTQYWIAAFPGSPTTNLAWNYNNYPTSGTGVSAVGADSANGGVSWYGAGVKAEPGGFAVSGTVVPEPTSLAVTGLGTLVLFCLPRKRKPQTAQ